MNERRWNLLGACLVSTVGLVIAGMTMGTWWAMVGLSIATFGFYGSKGPFWSMPPMFLTGTAAAASIAWINSIGNLGGFFGPWYVGVMKDLTDSYAGGLYGLAFLCADLRRSSARSSCTFRTRSTLPARNAVGGRLTQRSSAAPPCTPVRAAPASRLRKHQRHARACGDCSQNVKLSSM